MNQRTVKHTISCVGIGVHSGKMASISLYPAPVDSGIVFIRTDIKNHQNKIHASYNAVSKTMLGTTISNKDRIEVSTIEHLMAALWGYKIDNAIIEIDGPEIPIMDGSAEKFLFMLECAGVVEQNKSRKHINVLKEITVQEGDSKITLYPSGNFSIDAEIRFNRSCISSQKYQFFSNKSSFKHELARARTFGFKEDADILKEKGFAQGASLDNVIVISGKEVINGEGLRYNDEFVRHKLLDLIGDFYLAGGTINAHVEAFKPGHTINNKVLRKLFSDPSNWSLAS